jgi:hypothetical protein
VGTSKVASKSRKFDSVVGDRWLWRRGGLMGQQLIQQILIKLCPEITEVPVPVRHAPQGQSANLEWGVRGWLCDGNYNNKNDIEPYTKSMHENDLAL